MAAKMEEEVGLRKKKASVKNSLGNPYILTWPTVEKSVLHSIVSEIRRIFPAILGQKYFSKKRIKQLKCTTEEGMTEEDQILREKIKEKQELRKCLAIGINEVTRGLEKDELSLVLACRSVKPSLMIDHLMLLGATRQVPTIGLHNLGEVLASLLQCHKTAALGFKKQKKDTVFDPLVEFITPLVPEINVPWLQPFEETRMVQENVPDNKEHGQHLGVKRRHSDDSKMPEESTNNKKQKPEEKSVKLQVIEVNEQESKEANGKEVPLNLSTKNTKSNTKSRSTEINLEKEVSQKDKERARQRIGLERVRVCIEPIVIKQTTTGLNKKKEHKRKKAKSKTK